MEPAADRVLHVVSTGHPSTPPQVSRELSPGEFAVCWTPLLGPAAAAVHHALGVLASAPAPVDVGVDVVGSALGLRPRRARLIVPAALDRLERHGLCFVDGDTVVTRAAGPLPSHLRRRLPERWIAATAASADPSARGILGG